MDHTNRKELGRSVFEKVAAVTDIRRRETSANALREYELLSPRQRLLALPSERKHFKHMTEMPLSTFKKIKRATKGVDKASRRLGKHRTGISFINREGAAAKKQDKALGKLDAAVKKHISGHRGGVTGYAGKANTGIASHHTDYSSKKTYGVSGKSKTDTKAHNTMRSGHHGPSDRTDYETRKAK